MHDNLQVAGIDYDKTFTPVAKMGTNRNLLDVVVIKNGELHQMDVRNAFFMVSEDVYMKLPLAILVLNQEMFVGSKNLCMV